MNIQTIKDSLALVEDLTEQHKELSAIPAEKFKVGVTHPQGFNYTVSLSKGDVIQALEDRIEEAKRLLRGSVA